MILFVDREGPDQTMQIWAFAVHISQKTHFHMVCPKYSLDSVTDNTIVNVSFGS